ncbi:MAG TPA: hypothetical protein VKY89_22800 [Thermoanaerobaculia bacterium]|nr:hypothetical protein [Thermoanaerobaculia bacterium]
MPDLRSALDRYHGSERAAAQAQGSANAIGESRPKLRVEQAMKGPEKAIEAIVREIGPEAARLAVTTLFRELPFSVELAIRAVDRVSDLGLDAEPGCQGSAAGFRRTRCLCRPK